jgi:hypothetical protein
VKNLFIEVIHFKPDNNLLGKQFRIVTPLHWLDNNFLNSHHRDIIKDILNLVGRLLILQISIPAGFSIRTCRLHEKGLRRGNSLGIHLVLNQGRRRLQLATIVPDLTFSQTSLYPRVQRPEVVFVPNLEHHPQPVKILQLLLHPLDPAIKSTPTSLTRTTRQCHRGIQISLLHLDRNSILLRIHNLHTRNHHIHKPRSRNLHIHNLLFNHLRTIILCSPHHDNVSLVPL